MTFHKWFNQQSILIKAILLLLPVVGWICELLIRASVYLKEKDLVHLVVLILFVVVGWGWILCAIDFVYMLLNGHLILAD